MFTELYKFGNPLTKIHVKLISALGVLSNQTVRRNPDLVQNVFSLGSNLLLC